MEEERFGGDLHHHLWSTYHIVVVYQPPRNDQAHIVVPRLYFVPRQTIETVNFDINLMSKQWLEDHSEFSMAGRALITLPFGEH